VVIADTDVLLLEFAFQRDERQVPNMAFLARAQNADLAITVYNLMELLGKLSFNVSPDRLDEWQSWLIDAYQLQVIWPKPAAGHGAEAFFRSEIFERPLAKFRGQHMAFTDALVLDLAERTPNVEYLVTWNARHFKSKTELHVVTPAEYLAEAGEASPNPNAY
jgi:hypothetical protein